jgi:hypothetical protein
MRRGDAAAHDPDGPSGPGNDGRLDGLIVELHGANGGATRTAAEIEPLVESDHRRYKDLSRMNANARVLLLRNHERAGTSPVRPHSQIAVTEMRPRRNQRREASARRCCNANMRRSAGGVIDDMPFKMTTCATES